MAYTPDPNNTSEPTAGRPAGSAAEEFRLIKQKIASIIAGMVVTTAAGANAADLTSYFQPDINDRPAPFAAGWLPWNLNQQWGGAPMPFHMVDAATGVEYKFDAFDCYVANDTTFDMGAAAGTYYVYGVLTPAKNQSLQAIWLKLFKNGNPVDNVTVQLWSVAAGLPNALIATANTINGKQITGDSNGQWYRFSFAVVQALVAGTQYMIVCSKSTGVDAANYYRFIATFTTKYPNALGGQGTNAPVWTAFNTRTINFLAEAQASDQIFLSAGQFKGRIVGSEGTPINRSVAFNKPISECLSLFDPNGWSISIRGKGWTKDRTIFDAIYGLHHDRINVRSAVATGFTTVTVYKTDGTVVTVTGTSDISTATFKDILIVGRSVGDGGDYLKIYIGVGGVWTKEAELVGQTFTFDPLMLKQGTAWLMGGFQLFSNANYTKLSDMSILPSADGWTFTTTTATVEGTVFAISGGKLNQIKAGMAAGGDGFYVKAAALNNANGWLVTNKTRILSSTNTKDSFCNVIQADDGTKKVTIEFQEFFAQTANTGNNAYPQADLKSSDFTHFVSGKGSDFLEFLNGKLVVDGVGQMISASAANQVTFGDSNTVANENADAIWDYIGYYNTANIYPQFTSGELHEFAIFTGDKSLLGQATYNAGAPLSLKQYCGIPRNYAGSEGGLTQFFEQRGITNAPSTVSVTDVLAPEMERFVLGSTISAKSRTAVNNNTASQNSQTFLYVDGIQISQSLGVTTQVAAGGGQVVTVTNEHKKSYNFGLHKIETRYNAVTGGTTALEGARRSINVETKAYPYA